MQSTVRIATRSPKSRRAQRTTTSTKKRTNPVWAAAVTNRSRRSPTQNLSSPLWANSVFFSNTPAHSCIPGIIAYDEDNISSAGQTDSNLAGNDCYRARMDRSGHDDAVHHGKRTAAGISTAGAGRSGGTV